MTLIVPGLLNGYKECWNPWGKKGGACAFCGSGICCRLGNKNGFGCAGHNGCDGKYCCVEGGTKLDVCYWIGIVVAH